MKPIIIIRDNLKTEIWQSEYGKTKVRAEPTTLAEYFDSAWGNLMHKKSATEHSGKH